MHDVSIETTIKGGLPVIVEASMEAYNPFQYPGTDVIDAIDVKFLSGHYIQFALSDEDAERIEVEVYEEWKRDSRG